MLARLVVFALLVGAHPVAAQPAAAIGHPLPSPDLPNGTVTVRVIDGSVAMPHAGIAVWLSVDGIAKTANTDAAGRATFSGLKAGAKVIAAISIAGASIKSDAFAVPAEGGTRVMLTTVPFVGGAPVMPAARDISGTPRSDDTAPAGTLAVRLTYNDLADAHPPAKVAVRLASYAADGKVAVITQATDAKGIATFTGLDHSGAVAYYALATLPRAGKADRLVSAPVILGDEYGERVMLSAEKRTATAPPIDDLAPAAIAKGKLHVVLAGVTDAKTPVDVIEAATGKHLAAATGEKEATIALSPADRVVYVETTVRGEHYRSRPFQSVGDRGAEVTVYAYPRVLVTFDVLAEPAGLGIAGWVRFTVQNSAWSPYATPLAIPLPAGSTHVDLANDDRTLATVNGMAITTARPLEPGQTRMRVHFELAPGADGKVHWDLDLPNGAIESSFRIGQEPGVAIVDAKLPVATADGELVLSPISILPGQRMSMAIELPKLTPKQAAIARACESLAPDRKSALLGKPMQELTATGLDGATMKSSSMRGRMLLVNFMASWDMLSGKERPTFAPLAAALSKDLAIVLVASDADRAELAQKIGAKQPFRVVLDPPDGSGNIGPITTSWGVRALPESFLVDKRGVVRMYFSNSRDWSTPEARACLEVVAKD